MNLRSNIKSFTLVELLIVIAILAVLAAAVVIVLNPAELLAQARDTQRITDMKTLKDAADLFVVDSPTASLGTVQKVYLSLPDTSATCATYTTLPTLPAGWSYNCVTSTNLRNTNGTGWLPLDLSSIKGGSPIPYLPIDPQNDSSLTKYYQYIPGTNTYELTALLESEKQSKAASKDGGYDPGRLEIGSDNTLWRGASGLIGYWPFEGTGTIANGQTAGLGDMSGSSYNGTAMNANGTGMSFVAGKKGNAVSLDGSDDYIDVGQLAATGSFSISAWVYASNTTSQKAVMSKGDGGTTNYCLDLRNGDNSVAFFIYDSSAIARGLTGTTPQKVAANQWVYVTGVFNASATPNFQAFVNGASVGTTNWTGTLATSATTAQIGARNASNRFVGSVDDVRFYNRALTNAEVMALYNADK